MHMDDSSRYGSSALSASLSHSKRESEINQIIKRNEERKLQRISSGVELRRSLVSQQVEQEVNGNEKMHRYLETRTNLQIEAAMRNKDKELGAGAQHQRYDDRDRYAADQYLGDRHKRSYDRLEEPDRSRSPHHLHLRNGSKMTPHRSIPI